MFPLENSNPLIKLPLISSAIVLDADRVFRISLLFPKLLASPTKVVATILSNDPVELPPDPDIVPVNSKPCLKEPVIFEAICEDDDSVKGKSVSVSSKALPINVVPSTLPKLPVITSVRLPVDVIFPSRVV